MISRLPHWLHTEPPSASSLAFIQRSTYDKGISTVCREARCPNRAECARRKTATFLILGNICTRECRFCAVQHGRPMPLDPEEPHKVAGAVAALELQHAVVTSVTRDDLPDGGASVFAATVNAIRETQPTVTVELLVPDFLGSPEALDAVLDSRPDVIGHNLETVPRLYAAARPGASHERSLQLLRRASERVPKMITKSGIMIGMGESREEIVDLIQSLVDVGCHVLTIGQYLRPTPLHLPVQRFVHPHEFKELEEIAIDLGIKQVSSGPLVRSSYRAGEMMEKVTAHHA